jgi:LmbE family N-acetylglucosaminyl deacetylase
MQLSLLLKDRLRRGGRSSPEKPVTSTPADEDLAALNSKGPILIVSPHLDDAVFSCSGIIRSVTNPIVHTVFAGDAPLDQPLSHWDQACGFMYGTNVMEERRNEDRTASNRLSATTSWNQQLQEQYRTGDIDHVAVTNELLRTIEKIRPVAVMSPLGLQHTDHLALASILWTIVGEQFPDIAWYLYADKPYADRRPTLVRQRLVELRDKGLHVREVKLPWRLKRGDIGAIRSYASQLKGLQISAFRLVLPHHRIWRVVTSRP